MPAKQLRFNSEARDALRRGVDALASAVGVTLGPRGRNVVLDKKFGPPLIINDGVTIARDLDFADPFENMGAALIKEVAIKTSDVAGDGTTTATVLAQALISGGLRNLAAGAAPGALREGMAEAVAIAEKAIRALSIPVDGRDDLRRVATISAGSEEVGEMIADAFERVGKEGVVTVEENSGLDTEVKVVEGMQFDKGYISPYLVTDQATMEAQLDHPLILVTDTKVGSVADLVPVLDLAMQQKRPLLIVAEDVTGEALATLVVNKLRGTFTAVAVKAPGFGDRRKAMLADLAVLTGAQVISEDIGLRVESVQASHLGSARRVTVTKDDTTVVEGAGDKAAIDARCVELREQAAETESDWDREKLLERLARLAGGVALVRVGANTEVEMKELKARIDDALAATRAALEDGIVPGGGVALLRAAASIDPSKWDGDARTGAQLVREALEAPLRRIAENAGESGAVVANRIREASGNEGFDAATNEFTDLVKRGVIDPTKVVVTALTNAASIASILLTTEAVITDAPEDEEEHAGHGHGGGGGGGMGGMGGGMGGMGGMGGGMGGMGGMDDMDF